MTQFDPKESLARNGSCRSPVGHEKQERSLAILNPVFRLNGGFPAGLMAIWNRLDSFRLLFGQPHFCTPKFALSGQGGMAL
jgi:hypothetical protein